MFLSRIVPLCIATAFTTSLAVLDLPNAQPKVDESYWTKALDSTWQGLIRRNIQPYSAGEGLIHRPKSETPGDAVSEGVGYGMLVALYSNDQATFNKMWDAANTVMWDGCYYNWQMAPTGKISGMGNLTLQQSLVTITRRMRKKFSIACGKRNRLSGTEFLRRVPAGVAVLS